MTTSFRQKTNARSSTHSELPIRVEQATTDTTPVDDGEEPLPSFSQQMSYQLGGVRGLIESSVPVLIFVILNYVSSRTDWWSLHTSIISSVGFAVALMIYRLVRRQPMRHAINGIFGILIGGAIALRSGEAKDFHLPAMIYTAGYAIAMLVSVLARRPLVGWIWAVTLDAGGPRWYKHQSLRRVFAWLTILWSTVYILKVTIQYLLYRADQEDLLGISRLALGWPPYALLFALTVWSARRVIRRDNIT